MIVLLVSINVKSGTESAAEHAYSGSFKEAISVQPGFKDVKFLRPNDGDRYMLLIAFENQQFQQRWVATTLHAQVWGQLEANFDSYDVKTYGAV